MKNNPPYLGAAYYPEDWPAAEQDRDIEMMKKAGINSVRIAEFAWYKMEPKQGQYEFGWLHDIVNKLSTNGIAIVMCTPTATPPQWLSKRYPDVFIELENGRTSVHGGRRHCCSNNAHYRKYSAKIVEKLGEEFGNDPNVIGWQIDNELYCRDFASGSKMGCFCIDCVGKFHEYLREKYKTIENLNERWDLNIFSQCYDSFEDVPAPRDGWKPVRARAGRAACPACPALAADSGCGRLRRNRRGHPRRVWLRSFRRPAPAGGTGL